MPHIGPIACSTVAFAFVARMSTALADDAPTFADRADEEVRDADRTLCVLLNPLAMVVGVFGGEVDFVVSRYAAIALEGDVFQRDSTATALGSGLLVYPQGSPLHRLYVEPRVVFSRPLRFPITRVDWNIDVFGVGATAGWQWTWDYGFSARLGAGAMYFLGGPRATAETGALATGPDVVLDGSLGWAF